eukprot:gene1036-biopygen5771
MTTTKFMWNAAAISFNACRVRTSARCLAPGAWSVRPVSVCVWCGVGQRLSAKGHARGSGERPRHARATPGAQPRDRRPEDERSRGSVALGLSASEPACAPGMQRFRREKRHFRARFLFVLGLSL